MGEAFGPRQEGSRFPHRPAGDSLQGVCRPEKICTGSASRTCGSLNVAYHTEAGYLDLYRPRLWLKPLVGRPPSRVLQPGCNRRCWGPLGPKVLFSTTSP
eukprot:2587828-Lingulodinium_polyedra.AAC.1